MEGDEVPGGVEVAVDGVDAVGGLVVDGSVGEDRTACKRGDGSDGIAQV